jgi:hypothetical protein
MRIGAMRRTAIGLLGCAAIAATGLACNTARLPLRPDPGVTGYANIGIYSVQRFLYSAGLVERAVVETMADMKMHSVQRKPKDDGVKFLGLLFDGRYVCVAIEPEGQGCIVTVNFDIYGDEPLAKIFFERVAVRIATLPQSVNPPFDPRATTDTILHRGMDVEGYRGAPLR